MSENYTFLSLGRYWLIINGMKRKIILIINWFMAIMIPLQWLRMVFFSTSSVLQVRGLTSLRFFTILSNLLEAVSCWIYLLKGNSRLKLPAATSLALTFTVVMVFLGPLMGYPFMFMGVNFWFHFLFPLLAFLEYIFLQDRYDGKHPVIKAATPMLLYGIYYVANILINGLEGHDWYHFIQWGWGMGSVIIVVIIAITCLLAFCIMKAQSKVQKSIRS